MPTKITSEVRQAESLANLQQAGAERGLTLIDELATSDGQFVFYKCAREHTVKVKPSTTRSPHWAGQCEHCVYEERLNRLEEIARGHGGRISSNRKRLKTRDWVEIECAHGHKTKKRVYSVLEGTWCSKCFFESIRSSIDDAKDYADENGGKCLSTSCAGASDQLEWECAEGHQWVASLNEEQARKRFCPICKTYKADRKRKTGKTSSKDVMLIRAHKVAASRGGKCLATRYTTTREKLEWECGEGHRWLAPAQSVLYNGAWCNICAMKKRPGAITIEKLRAHASKRGGELISEEYQRNDIKLDWRCAEGHEFKRSWMVMRKTKNFCPLCRK